MKKSSSYIIENFFLKHSSLNYLKQSMTRLVDLLSINFYKGGKILVCGNGGSGADSEHIVGELMKGFVLNRDINDHTLNKIRELFPNEVNNFKENLQIGIPAISLVSQTGLISAYNNDKNSDYVYAQQVFSYGKPFDTLICLSTSGNSTNILNAAKISKVLGITVVGFTGFSGGKLKEFSDYLINVPSQSTSEIQEFHLPIYHTICLALEEELFGLNYL
jgi:D-sedoheptulose 7-phosphate isomerase